MTHLPHAHQNMPKQSQTREKECGWWWGEPDRHSTSAGSVESRIEPTGIYSPNLATETNQQKFFNVTLRDSLDMNIKITWDHWFDGQPYIMLRSHLSEVPSIVPLDHRYRGGGETPVHGLMAAFRGHWETCLLYMILDKIWAVLHQTKISPTLLDLPSAGVGWLL